MGILLDGGTSLPQGAIGDAGHQGGRRQAASTSRSRDRSAAGYIFVSPSTLLKSRLFSSPWKVQLLLHLLAS
jgi:hypothetical protein